MNFPDSPVLNQQYSFGGKVFQWNGSAWKQVNSGAILPVANGGTGTSTSTGTGSVVLSNGAIVIFGDGSQTVSHPLKVYSTPGTTPLGFSVWRGAEVNAQNIHIHTSDGTANVIESNSTTAIPLRIKNNTPEAIAFYISNTEYMRLSLAGRMLIGTTTDDGINKLQVNGPASVGGQLALGGSINGTNGGAVYGHRFLQNNTGSILAYKLATLPTTGNSTFENVVLEGVFDSSWASTNKTTFKILVSNRGALTVQYEKGASRNSYIEIYTESDGSVSVWGCMAASTYTTLNVNVYALSALGPYSVVLYQNPTTGTQTGTLSFSTVTAVPAYQLQPSGRVLMGTNTDDGSNKLQVTGNTALTGNLAVSGTGSVTGLFSTVKKKNIGASSSTNGGTVIVDDNANYDPRLKFYRWQGTASQFSHSYLRFDNSGTLFFEKAATAATAGVESESGTISTIMSISANGTLSITALSSGVLAPGILSSVNNNVFAAGTTQATATALASDINVVTSSTVGSAVGVQIPGATAGKFVVVDNQSANAINVYPSSGHSIDGTAANTPVVVPSKGLLELYGASTTAWYSTNNAVISGKFVLPDPNNTNTTATDQLAISRWTMMAM